MRIQKNSTIYLEKIPENTGYSVNLDNGNMILKKISISGLESFSSYILREKGILKPDNSNKKCSTFHIAYWLKQLGWKKGDIIICIKKEDESIILSKIDKEGNSFDELVEKAKNIG